LKVLNLDETGTGAYNETNNDLYKSFSMPSPGLRPILLNKNRLNSDDYINTKEEKKVSSRLNLNSSAQFQKSS